MSTDFDSYGADKPNLDAHGQTDAQTPKPKRDGYDDLAASGLDNKNNTHARIKTILYEQVLSVNEG